MQIFLQKYDKAKSTPAKAFSEVLLPHETAVVSENTSGEGKDKPQGLASVIRLIT
jgi:hypothetical protein